MGIFSIFKKKANPPRDAGEPSVLRAGQPSRLGPDPEAERARQREIARATALKIDAIESEMTFDIFNTPEPAWGSGKRAARSNAQPGAADPATVPMLELATTALLADEELAAAPVQPETAPLVEEIAIMYANGQQQLAEQMLIESLSGLGLHERSVWWMLFDLYQASGQHEAFDNIAIDYASRFETSPPTWTAAAPAAAGQPAFSGVTPTEAFIGVLDEASAPQLQRLQQLAATSPVFRLEFNRLREVTPAGCALLLGALDALRARQRELIVAGAAELAELLRARLEVGRRDASPAQWLLLLTLLQLMNREKEFEEAAMDYCVTYEVSPPSFEAPAHVATAASARAPSSSDRFLLPALIDGAPGPLLEAIDAYAAGNEPVVLDCSRLARADYGAAGALLARLRLLAEAGKNIELRELNHMVAALFRLLGYADVARLFPHKY